MNKTFPPYEKKSLTKHPSIRMWVVAQYIKDGVLANIIQNLIGLNGNLDISFFFSYSLFCHDSVSVPFFSFECLSKMGRKDSSCVALDKILYCAPENESNFHGKHSQGCTEKANKES